MINSGMLTAIISAVVTLFSYNNPSYSNAMEAMMGQFNFFDCHTQTIEVTTNDAQRQLRWPQCQPRSTVLHPRS